MRILSYLENYEEHVVKFQLTAPKIFNALTSVYTCVVIKRFLYIFFALSYKIMFGCIYLRMAKSTLSLCVCKDVRGCKNKDPPILKMITKFMQVLSLRLRPSPGKYPPMLIK